VCVPRARGVWRAGVRPRPWTHAHVRRGRTVLKMFDVHGGGEDHLARALAAGSFWVGLVRTQLDRDWPCPCAFFLCHRLEHASENGLEIPGASVSVFSSSFLAWPFLCFRHNILPVQDRAPASYLYYVLYRAPCEY